MAALAALALAAADPVAATGAVAAPQAAASAAPRAASPSRRVPLTVTVLIDGSPAGDVGVQTDSKGDALIDAKQLLAVVRPIVSRELAAALAAREGEGMVSIASLNGDQMKIAFDLATLRVLIAIPAHARSTSDLSIIDNRTFNEASRTKPEDLAAGVTFSIADRFRHVSGFGDIEREKLTVLAQGFANVGGIDGVNLTFQGGLREGNRFDRQRTTLFHDDVGSAVRYAIGDLDPQTFGAFGAPVSLLGIGVERLYQEIQPYRNLRPAGRGALAIERPSRVDVLVNGTLYRTLTLGPGQYNLRDFPFLDGINDVQLVVRDDAGREEAINLSFFSDTELLDSGISTFSAAFGLRRDRFGDFIGTTYRDSQVLTGFYQRGITDRLTVGGSVEADKRNGLVTGQVAVGSDWGLFGLQAAVDVQRGSKATVAYLLTYRYRSPAGSGDIRRGGQGNTLDVNVQYLPKRFSPMQPDTLVENNFSYDISARYQTSLSAAMFATLGAGYSIGRGAQRDVLTLSASTSRRIGRFNLGVNYSYRENSTRSDHRVAFSLSIPLSRRQFARAGYDTDRNRVSVDYDLNGFQGLNETSARVSLAREDDGREANIDIEHYANRFQAFLRHDYSSTDGVRTEFTDVGASVAIGYAGGRVAIGRDAARGFTIVAAHPTLRDAQVTASDNYTLGPTARTGLLGPALVPTQRPYQPNSIQIKVDDLPIGYDIGQGRIDVLPGAASGYLLTVGSAASNTVIGRVMNAKGEPASYLAGNLVPVSGKDAAPVLFFTNRTGRLSAQKVAPGRYRVVPQGGTSIGEIEVPQNPSGPVDIGVLQVKE